MSAMADLVPIRQWNLCGGSLIEAGHDPAVCTAGPLNLDVEVKPPKGAGDGLTPHSAFASAPAEIMLEGVDFRHEQVVVVEDVADRIEAVRKVR